MPRCKLRRYLKHGTLTQLSVFEAVARHGSFTRAAEELHLAQPTVSVQIRKLTESAGLPLFARIGRKVQLTDAGRLLYAACQQIFCTLSQLEAGLCSMREVETGQRVTGDKAAGLVVPDAAIVSECLYAD